MLCSTWKYDKTSRQTYCIFSIGSTILLGVGGLLACSHGDRVLLMLTDNFLVATSFISPSCLLQVVCYTYNGMQFNSTWNKSSDLKRQLQVR